MGTQDYIVHFEQRVVRMDWLLLHGIQSRIEDFAVFQRPGQIRLGDNRPSGGVDDHCRALHPLEDIPIENVPSFPYYCLCCNIEMIFLFILGKNIIPAIKKSVAVMVIATIWENKEKL